MKTNKTIKSILSFIFLFACATFPLSSFAGLPWAASIDNSGNISASVGSSAAAIAANNGSYGGFFGGGWSLSNPYGLPQGSILGILSNLLFWLLAIFAILGVTGFVLSGIFYLLAGADEDNAKKGKSGMKYSIMGIIVGLSGFIIMQAVASFLSGSSKTF